MYLYKHFREDPTIQQLGKTYSTQELMESFSMILPDIHEAVDNLVVLYAIIMALTFKKYQDVREFFVGLSSYSNIQWANALKNLFMSLSKITEIYEIQGDYDYISPIQFQAHNYITKRIDISMEPKNP